jgi:hypothetical protein
MFWADHAIVELRTDILKPIQELEESLYDPVWNSPQMSNELGIVALDQDFIKEKNLPQAMRYPWDESKNVYVISFHHSIHCLVSPNNEMITLYKLLLVYVALSSTISSRVPYR